VAQGPLRTLKERAAARTVVQGPDDGPDGPEGQDPGKPDSDEDTWRRAIPWGKVLLASLAITVLALAGITVVEAISGKPISSVTGGSDSQGTTVGNFTGSNKSKKDTGPSDKTKPGTDNPGEDQKQNQDQNNEPAPDPNSGQQDDQPQDPEPSAPATPVPSDGQSVVPQGAPTPPSE
jgi:hypothetical protein